MRHALESEPGLGQSVALWLDLVGVLEGTPLLDGGMESERVASRFLSRRTRRSMSASVRRRAANPDAFPAVTRAVHLAAFPHVADVSVPARASFELLRALGPNDGYVMLDVYLRCPGRVLLVRGSDHYLRPANLVDLRPRLLAIMHALLDELGEVD